MKMKFQKAMGIAIMVVVPLSVIQWRFPLPAISYALLPGNVISLLLTGGHGASMTQDAVAPFAAALVNITVYAAVIRLCMAAGSGDR